MTEKSPLDLITEIHSMLSLLSSRVALIEQNIALLHEKTNGGLTQPTIKVATTKMISSPKLDLETKTIGVALPQTSPPINDSRAAVHGKVYSPDKRPIHNATIIIKNQKNEVVGQPKTNLAGEWEMRLAIGKYALTYSKPGMSPIYRFVEVKSGMKDLEVL